MANRLNPNQTAPTPKTWFVECKYCNPPADTLHQYAPRRHEQELLDRAKKLCKHHETNHFLDYVTAELDTLDHSVLTPITMIEILTQIHNSVPCSCLTDTTAKIESLTKSSEHVTIPVAYSQNPTHPRTPKTHPKTLLERLQNGKNGTHKTG